MRKGENMGLFTQYDESKTKSIKLLDVNDHGPHVWVTFQVCYGYYCYLVGCRIIESYESPFKGLLLRRAEDPGIVIHKPLGHGTRRNCI